MPSFRHLPIAHKLSLISLLSSAVVIIAASVSFVVYQQRVLRGDRIDMTATVARMLAVDVAGALSFNDVQAADQSLRSLDMDPRVSAAAVYDASGLVFSTYHRPGAPAPRWPAARVEGFELRHNRLDLFRDITVHGERIGLVYVQSDLAELNVLLLRHIAVAVVAAFVGVAVTWFLASRLQRVVSEPVQHLVDVAAKVATARDYSLRARKRANDELGQLVDVFNDMLAQIQSRDADLERRVAERTERLTAEIADRTRAQEDLRRSADVLRRTQEVAQLGSYVLDVVAGQWVGSPTLYAIFGIDESYARTVESWVGLLPPDERDRLRTYLSDHVLRGRNRFNLEYHIIRHSDGEERWVNGLGELECDAAGVPLRMIGTIQDITDRKRIEAAQRASEEKYRCLTEEINDVIWELNADLQVTYISPAVEAAIGFKPGEVLGHIVLEWFDAATAQRIKQLIVENNERAARGEKGAMLFQVPIRRKDGGQVWVELSTQRITNRGHRLVGFRGIMRDITARKQIEEELRESQEHLTYERDQLEALLEASPDSIYFKDLQSRLVRISRSKALKVLETVPALKARSAAAPTMDPVSFVLGITDFDTYQPEDAQHAYDDEQTIIQSGLPLVNKMERQVCQDGTVVWHLTSKMPWRDRDGKIIGTFGVSKDITALKRAEEEVEKVHRQLVDASRQAGMAEVATGILHNVGNALNSVNVSASLVLDQIRASRAPYVAKAAVLLEEHAGDLAKYLTEDPKGQKLPTYFTVLGQTLVQEQKAITDELEQLRRNVEHIKEIVAMQQTYARVAGVIEPVPIVEIVEDAIRMNSAALSRHEVDLDREFATRPTITTDRHKILQILVNLLRNAKYACDESGRSDKRITIGVVARAERYAISVHDNGIGIPPENLVRIFSHGFTTRKGGHGFGLHSGAIAAKELGGTLTVESAGPGAGATFTLELPVTPPAR